MLRQPDSTTSTDTRDPEATGTDVGGLLYAWPRNTRLREVQQVRIARVALDIPARGLTAAFDYDVPAKLDASVEIGVGVVVPFGSRTVVGHVVEILETSHVPGRRDLLAVVSPPRFDATAAQLASRIANEYAAPLSEAVRLLLPPGGVPKAIVGSDGWRLSTPTVAPVEERVVELADGSTFQPSATAHRQRAVLDALGAGPVTVGELTASLGQVSSVLSRLQEAGAVTIISRRRFRDPSVHVRPAPRHETLSDGQQAALEAIASAQPGERVLLDGVTGSGKTEVYLRAIEDVCERGLRAVVLVPEISLTPQTVGRFRARFGDRVGVVHSRLSAGERLDQWERIATGHARVVVGARSALFAPVSDLGLIVIDEEHESSYKQSSAPRYHARRVAGWLAEARGAVLVLGSATPALETRAAVERGVVTRVEMPERVGGGRPPAVEVVDLGAEFLGGNRSMFSRRLVAELKSVQERGEKAVLFLNRRGFASFLLCRECGHVPGCERCSTSLTFHETGPRLMCHHCGVRSAVPPQCPECGSPYLRRFGAGTQRVASDLESVVPGLAVVRMDADTTSAKGGHETRLAEFEALKSGVLVGTQMVAKGLDYPEVTLVGVISADTTIHLPDFRSGERTYQMLEQVAGRAGRGERAGTVVIQTYWPEHPAIRAVAAHDPSLFYGPEIEARRELRFPPYGRLANVLVAAASEDSARAQAAKIAEALVTRAEQEWEVLGPVPAPLARIKGRFRWHVLVKGPPAADIPSAVRGALETIRAVDGVSVAPDIDPLDLL